MSQSPRVAVIGAGILGASIAYHLARVGAVVTLVDRDAVPSEATAGSFAWINASAGNRSPYYELRLQAMLEWRGLAETLGEALPLRWGGSLEWQDDAAALERDVREQAARGYAVRLVGRKEIRDLEPGIAEPPEAAAFASHEGAVEPVGAALALAAAAGRLGARVLRGVTARLLQDGNRVTVSLEGERFEADCVVLAVGAATESVAGELGVNLPMANRPGLLLHSKPHAPLLSRLVLSPGAHIKQDSNGRVVSGEDFGGGTVPNDPEAEALRLLERVKSRIAGSEGLELDFVTTGVRPVPRDGFPVLGFAVALDGLYLAAMHSGVTLAPLAGRLAAAEIVGAQPLDVLAPFRPERFGAA